MLRKLGAAIYRGLFWTYERGTWQYDIMVALILAFIFLTPPAWFNDKPRPLGRDDVILVSNGESGTVYQLRAALLNADDAAVRQEAARVLATHTGKAVQIIRIEPARDSQGQVVSYAVWVQE